MQNDVCAKANHHFGGKRKIYFNYILIKLKAIKVTKTKSEFKYVFTWSIELSGFLETGADHHMFS